MSRLKWQEFAMRKTELRDKSNFLHDTILKNPLGEKTSQESFQKVFKPITTKLDDVALSNLKLPILQTNVVQKWQFSIMGLLLKMNIFLIMDYMIYLTQKYNQNKINN